MADSAAATHHAPSGDVTKHHFLPLLATAGAAIEEPQKVAFGDQIGIRTHVDCIPPANKPSDPRGEWAGWARPYHGSRCDTDGRVRHGPAQLNLWALPYAFESDSKIKVG